MAALVIGICLLALSFLFHLALWRVALPRRQTLSLIAVFAIVPVLAIAAAALLGRPVRLGIAEGVRIGLFYVSFSLAYIVCYSAIENESPTLAIVSFVARSGKDGCLHTEIVKQFGPATAIEDRFAVMERGGWVICDRGVLRLSAEGHMYGSLFTTAAQIFGLAKGG